MLLFNTFKDNVEKYASRMAVNNLTYRELLDAVLSHTYTQVCDKTDWTVILDVLKASMLNKPLVILPKFNRDQVTVPCDLKNQFEIVLFSSGSSSGTRKSIFITDEMLMGNAASAIDCQVLNYQDVILTVCSLNHTGGLNAQTLAGLMVGAHIIVEQFNAFNFLRLIRDNKVTVTHLIPIMIDALIKVDADVNLDNLRLVMAGSDCVSKEHVNYWLKKSVPFIINYGMTEAGPIIINHLFSPGDDLSIFSQGVPLGTQTWCDTAIDGNVLKLKGNSVITGNTWLDTGDCVVKKGNWFIYRGRQSAGCKIIPKHY